MIPYNTKKDDNQQSSIKASSYRQSVIPYDSLTFDGVADSKMLNFSGWNIGKQIHKKYGFPSQQQQLIEYAKILDVPKKDVDRYLGIPVAHETVHDDNYNGDVYTYKASFGSIEVGYEKDVSWSFEVDYDLQFKGYIDVLRSIGITTLKRPFAVNEFSLLYNSNMGNNLVNEYNVVISISLPHPSEPRWKIFLQL